MWVDRCTGRPLTSQTPFDITAVSCLFCHVRRSIGTLASRLCRCPSDGSGRLGLGVSAAGGRELDRTSFAAPPGVWIVSVPCTKTYSISICPRNHCVATATTDCRRNRFETRRQVSASAATEESDMVSAAVLRPVGRVPLRSRDTSYSSACSPMSTARQSASRAQSPRLVRESSQRQHRPCYYSNATSCRMLTATHRPDKAPSKTLNELNKSYPSSNRPRGRDTRQADMGHAAKCASEGRSPAW